ncbi:dUTP diphosphatase [Leucobacter sp. M11]|uniref:dUTP diphosphatase n=1 Tax=Leucobacter sp. M11 TaxID=2993565 RepID=UPI002D8115E2|nr:dUTP diphosphatase [Leucobacter sp. M11]MEB4616172.1 dUTP diphosphatase [Leucobacter sp. M11]
MTDAVEILIQAEHLPAYAHPGDAGADLRSTEALVLGPGERATIGTGVSLALPAGTVAFVVPRSGLAAKRGITVVNSPGTVDAGYRGEIRVTLLNTDRSEPFEIQPGDRIAQIIFQRFVQARFVPAETLPGSDRGTGGFGSTGVRDAATTDAPAGAPAHTDRATEENQA